MQVVSTLKQRCKTPRVKAEHTTTVVLSVKRSLLAQKRQDVNASQV